MMKKLVHSEFRRVFAGLMLLVIGVLVPLQADAKDAAAQIDEVWNQYSSGLRSGNIDLWISLWADDGIQMPPGSPPVIGKEAIRAKMKSILDGFAFDITITNQEVGVVGDWAFARGVYKATLTPKAGGTANLIDGKYMTILHRKGDASWKIYRDIYNSNGPE
jgi:uncharacterized protein (TIGR02246 family)